MRFYLTFPGAGAADPELLGGDAFSPHLPVFGEVVGVSLDGGDLTITVDVDCTVEVDA